MQNASNMLDAFVSWMVFPSVVIGLLWAGGLLFKFDFAKNQNLVHNVIKVYVILVVLGVIYSLTRPSLQFEQKPVTTATPKTVISQPPAPIHDRTRQPKMTDEERAKHYEELTEYKTKDQ